ncbi:hypothetical protein INT43_003608 [Umbelopsis isabellina]|uniref:Proteasome assembly chaperone 1 n=1 Tax=Mortierella isabellina TaxID=91625 RepID=A0A8H7UEB9_MORIS|nr:hypothetical protein INT43_003608 [Umbelopsis isabellina]
MDFSDEFATIPTRYAFDDDSDQEDIDQAVDKLDLETFKVDFNNFDTASINTVIFGVYGPGDVFLRAVYEGQSVVGTIYAKTKLLASMHTSPSAGNVISVVSEDVLPEDAINGFAHAMLSKLPNANLRVIVLDSYYESGYIASDLSEQYTEPTLKCLRTSVEKKASQSPTSIDSLPAPNLSKGIAAAILTYCEIHQLPGLALFSPQPASLGKNLITEATIDYYEEALGKIGVDHLRSDQEKVRRAIQSRKYGKDSGKIDADHHRMYI